MIIQFEPHPTSLGGYVCAGADGCGVDVVDRDQHSGWHARLEGRLQDAATRLRFVAGGQ
jgi:hypothetical protein